MDTIPEKIQKPKEGGQKKIEEKLSLEGQEVIEKEQKFTSAAEKISESPKQKPVSDSSQKTTKKQAASIKGVQRQRQVKILADLAMEKGVHYAVAMAKKMESAYVLDELHDTLVDELYEELKSRGLL